jgi:hypothetical protein
VTNLADTSRGSRTWSPLPLRRAAAVVIVMMTTGSIGGPATAAPRSPSPAALAAQAASCPAVNGQTLTHQNDITTAETWAGDGTVHRITFGITIRPGGSLTLAPCTVVTVNAGLVLTVTGTPAAQAKLVSQGTATRPVLVTSAVAGQQWGMWRGLTPQSTFELSYTTFENGGKGSFHGAALSVRGGGRPEAVAVPVLTADHLVIKDSVGTGLVMESAAAFTADSTELTVTGGGGTPQGGDYAIEISPIAAGTLPKLNVSGNAHDAIRIAAPSLYISRDLTLKNLGVPYYFVFDRVRITDASGGTTPTLTIEPGVELRFDDYLQVGFFTKGVTNQPGRLLAVGTAAKPIVFTSSKSTRTAGDWPGIFLLNAAGSRLEHVRIEYAGGPNGISSSNCKPVGTTDAAALFITLENAYTPAASDFTGVTIANSKSHGINAMWTAAAPGPDVTGGFNFESINGCRQTRNRTLTGCVPSAGCLEGAAVTSSSAGTAVPLPAVLVPVATTTGRTTVAAITSPLKGSTLAGNSVTFSWTAGTGVTNYWLDVGTAAGQGNVAASGAITGLSFVVTGLPADGTTTVHAQLWTFIDGMWKTPERYAYTAGTQDNRAVLIAPAPGSKLSGASVTFSWTAGASGTTNYWLDVGTVAGQGNIAATGAITGLSFTVTGLPVDGSIVHAQVWTFKGGAWLTPTKKTYVASGP